MAWWWPTMLRDAWLVLRRDLRLEWRTRTTVNQVVPFVLAIVLLFAFALDADSATLVRASAGLFWIAVLFAASMIVQRVASVDQRDGVGDALRMSGIDPAGAYIGRTLALSAQLVVTEAVLGLAIVAFYGIDLRGLGLLAVTGGLATLGIAAVGSIYGPLVAGIEGRETVLPLLFLPVQAPVLLAAARASEVALGRGVGSGWPWAAMLGMLAVIYLGIGVATASTLAEET
ncbi:MAG: heme exporter protein CcmB [Actinobacteria bacterium]|nr:heme exporter protein CcmB [Actinomycetota bacterium]